MAGLGLGWIGFTKDFDKTMDPAQAEGVRSGIKGLLTLYPSVTLALAALTLLLLYPLTESKLASMLDDMYERDAAELKTGDVTEFEGVADAEVLRAVHHVDDTDGGSGPRSPDAQPPRSRSQP